MNKQKICIVCPNKLTKVQQLFCSNDCYLIGLAQHRQKEEYIRHEKQILKGLQEITELETEVLYAKKQNLILKESVNFDVPFIRIQEERYSKKIDKNEGIVLPEDSDVIEVN